MKKNYLNLLAGFCLLALTACGGDAEQTDTPSESGTTTVPANSTIEGLTQQIEGNPNSAELYAARGAIWYQNENYDDGIVDLEKAIELDSTKPEYYHVLADMYMDYYKSRAGLNVMERAGRAFPKRIPTLLKLSEFQFILQQHNDALFTLERIRAIEPLNAEMFFMFGNVFKDMGRKEEAIGAYQSAVENDPDLIDAWINLANLLADKDAPAAEKYFDNAIRMDSTNVDALHAKAYFLSNKKNDLEGAIALYKKINTIDLQYVEGYYNLGLLYLDMDSLQQAYDSFDRAVKFAPQFAEGYYHRGVAAEKMGNSQQAKADYENTLNLAPEFASAKAGLDRIK